MKSKVKMVYRVPFGYNSVSTHVKCLCSSDAGKQFSALAVLGGFFSTSISQCFWIILYKLIACAMGFMHRRFYSCCRDTVHYLISSPESDAVRQKWKSIIDSVAFVLTTLLCLTSGYLYFQCRRKYFPSK